jgi:hypothetical protein
MVSVTDLFWTTVVCSEATEGRTVRDNRGMADRIMDILDIVFCLFVKVK